MLCCFPLVNILCYTQQNVCNILLWSRANTVDLHHFPVGQHPANNEWKDDIKMSGRITAIIINNHSSRLALKGTAALSGDLPTQRRGCVVVHRRGCCCRPVEYFWQLHSLVFIIFTWVQCAGVERCRSAGRSPSHWSWDQSGFPI